MISKVSPLQLAKIADRQYLWNQALRIFRKNDPQFFQAIEEDLKKSRAENSYGRNRLSVRHIKAHLKNRKVSKIEGNEVLMRRYINKRKCEIKVKRIANGKSENEVASI